MASNVGRKLKLLKNDVVIAGLRTKGIAFAGEPVDITTDDDLGYRTLLGEAGQVTVDISFDGVTKDAVLRAEALSNVQLLLTDISIEYPNGDTLSGDFFLAGYEETGTYNDAVTFTGSLQSSGAWTYTPVVTAGND